ncbi:GvpL/GvpF family gas vesicle protein [Streptomyces sp. NPDC014802]|uniref:GvpL/GvpF family gas vesicle protein n=1 Tax=Streptomyces sp. NPDC014802 TaxID=3364917 RepID=UPI003702F6BA
MSARTAGDLVGPRGGVLVCVFAVTGAPRPAGAADARGHEEGGPLRVLTAGELFLHVQDVPVAAFGEEPLRARLERADDLERLARAHHRAVEAAARCGAVVPLPLATLFHGDDSAVAAVAERSVGLVALLQRLRGRTEWAVKVHAAGAGVRAPDAGDAATVAGGRAYLSRASARRRTEREGHAQALAEAHAVDEELRRYAVAATRHRPQSEQLTGRREPQLLNAAYLVDDARRNAFRRALARLATAGRAPAVRVTASGPWVPYSFARWDETAEAHGSGVAR